MVANLTQTIQNNKCPHGFIVGTCPICSGMGSRASSNKDKPRKAGEMSYNECLAQWMKMQALQNAKKEASIQRFENLFLIKDKILSLSPFFIKQSTYDKIKVIIGWFSIL